MYSWSLWKKSNKPFEPKNTVHRFKHAERSIMLWGLFAASETGEPMRVQGVMVKEAYLGGLNIYESCNAENSEY